jgi:hypothetical protein
MFRQLYRERKWTVSLPATCLSALDLSFGPDEKRTNTGQAATIESIDQYHYTSGVQILFHRAGMKTSAKAAVLEQDAHLVFLLEKSISFKLN